MNTYTIFNNWIMERFKYFEIQRYTMNTEITIDEFEKSIEDSAVEICGVFRDGHLVFTKVGSEDLIDVSPGELQDISGCVFTHNHPDDKSFSMADIIWACEYNVREIRVAAKSGCRYSMKLKDDNNFTYPFYDEKLHFLILDLKLKGYNKFKDIPDYNNPHEIWLQVAKEVKELLYTFKI